MNIFNIGDNYALNIFNCIQDDIGLVGHYRCCYNPVTGRLIMCKLGDFGNLISYIPTPTSPIFEATEEQRAFVIPRLARRISVDGSTDLEHTFESLREIYRDTVAFIKEARSQL